ncbi:MAG: hypothetical protein GC145_18720 [Caulobacter sp.]|nr:hypothetical protein [Caulobacter sp.]
MTVPFSWKDPARSALLRDLYVRQQLPAGEVARRFSEELGLPVKRETISRRVIVLGLAKLVPAEVLIAQRRGYQRLGVERRLEKHAARGGFTWTAARLARLEHLYVTLGWPARQIADDIGGGCNDILVRKQAHKRNLADKRAPGVGDDLRAAARLAGSRRGAAVTSERFRQARVQAGRRAEPPRPAARPALADQSRLIEPDLRARIDAAIAAGRVTVLPPGTAAGLSSAERAFHAAPAGSGDWKEAQRHRRQSQAWRS